MKSRLHLPVTYLLSEIQFNEMINKMLTVCLPFLEISYLPRSLFTFFLQKQDFAQFPTILNHTQIDLVDPVNQEEQKFDQ